MSDLYDIESSATLLEKLKGQEDRDAWDRFVSLYRPMIDAWGRRFGLPAHDVDELRSNVLLRLVRALPTFQYDPSKGGFRSWLKTVVVHEVSNLGRALQRRVPGDRGTGDSDVADRLAEHPEAADDLIDGVRERSESLMGCIRDAQAKLEAECRAKNSLAFEAFRLTCLEGQPVKDVQRQLGYESYFALTQAARRIKKRVKAQAWQFARERGLIEPDSPGSP